MNKIPIIAVVGPTASGKTALAVSIAKEFGGEVISADSMQIYKGMSIATAKPTADEMQGITHRMIDFLEPSVSYSVARYVEDANLAIDETLSAGKIPVLCGGTGLYVDSLLGNMSFAPENETSSVREELMKSCEENGIESLFEELKSIDPEYAATVHINNKVRIIRALEIFRQSGEKPSLVRARAFDSESRFSPLYIGIDYKDRDILYSRINLRVDIMLQNGLLNEAGEYLKSAGTTAVQAIGYKELSPYFAGSCSLPEAVENLKKATRHYAKRQLTWLRRNKEINWIYPDSCETSVNEEAFNLIRSFFNKESR